MNQVNKKRKAKYFLDDIQSSSTKHPETLNNQDILRLDTFRKMIHSAKSGPLQDNESILQQIQDKKVNLVSLGITKNENIIFLDIDETLLHSKFLSHPVAECIKMPEESGVIAFVNFSLTLDQSQFKTGSQKFSLLLKGGLHYYHVHSWKQILLRCYYKLY
jgi:hypothetical protein